jgi:hypothetical protein
LPRPDQKRAGRIAAIKRRILQIDRICSGTLLERTKVCGKTNCRCAVDPASRHGPYHEWNRREQGRLRHRVVTTDEARQISQAQDRYQALLGLLEAWEQESAQAILGVKRLTDRKRGS